MPITYVIDPVRNIITESWTGSIRIADLGAHWRTYLADPAVMDCRRTLVVLGDAQMEFTGSELSALVQSVVLPALQGRKWATALVATDSVQYGTSRQYQVFADTYSEDSIFTDRSAAEEWLVRQHPDDGGSPS